jgi:hypothetical protein
MSWCVPIGSGLPGSLETPARHLLRTPDSAGAHSRGRWFAATCGVKYLLTTHGSPCSDTRFTNRVKLVFADSPESRSSVVMGVDRWVRAPRGAKSWQVRQAGLRTARRPAGRGHAARERGRTEEPEGENDPHDQVRPQEAHPGEILRERRRSRGRKSRRPPGLAGMLRQDRPTGRAQRVTPSDYLEPS